MAQAQTQAQTLEQALEQAWSRNPVALSLAARQGEAQARAEVAHGLTPAPAAVSLSNASDRFNSNGGKNAWELELATPLWLPGQRDARRLEGERALSDVQARRAVLRLQIAGELREVWWVLAQARQHVALAQHRAQTAQALHVDVQRRLRAGEVARVDANLAHNEQLVAQTELADAQGSVRQAEQSYRLLTGQDAPSELSEETAAPITQPDANHPLLQAASSTLQLAQARFGVAQHTRSNAPELALRWVRERGDFNTAYANAVGVKLTLPFSSGARVRQESFAAQAEADLAQAELSLARERVTKDTQRARTELEQASALLERLLLRRDLSADNLRLAEKSYALGESDLPAVLRARAAAWEAETALRRGRVARAAGASRLNQTLGVLP